MSDQSDVGQDNPEHVDVDAYRSSPPSDNPFGAIIVTAYARRRVKAYPVIESEIGRISMFNTLSLVCFSCMSAFISFAFGIWANALFVPNPPAEGKILSDVVAPACCLAAIVAAGLGLWAILSRTNAWRDIRRESGGEA